MSLAVKVLKIAGWTMLSLIVADLVGVVASFVLDVLFSLPIQGASVGAFYALWLVIGIFAGMLSYNVSKGAADAKDAGATGRLVCGVVAVVLAGLSFLCHYLSGNMSGDYFVPDNFPLTVTFLVAFGVATFFAHNLLADSVPKQIEPTGKKQRL